jgi:hypothetical protein
MMAESRAYYAPAGWLRLALPLALSVALGVTAPARAQYPFDVPYVPTPQVVADEMPSVASSAGFGNGRVALRGRMEIDAGLPVSQSQVLIAEEQK